jgi:hypothetical protein
MLILPKPGESRLKEDKIHKTARSAVAAGGSCIMRVKALQRQPCSHHGGTEDIL